jgi:hypothetical protein
MSDSNAIFLPNPHLQTLFEELQEEFASRLDSILNKPDPQGVCVEAGRDVFEQGFHTHTHRFQQLFLLLRDVDLIDNAMMDTNIVTGIVTPDYQPGMMIPTIRQKEDYMYVGFETAPVDLDCGRANEPITVATVPLMPADKTPYNGKSVLATTVDEETEVVLITHSRADSKLLLVWSDTVQEEIRRISPVPKKELN